jgi:hypothetical protein
MINEEQIVNYFEALAISSKAINHTADGGKSFFYIDEPDNLDEFDQALRSSATSPAMLLIADEGEFDDNNTANHTQEISGQFYILAKTNDDFTKRNARAMCLPIVLDFLARMIVDARKNKLIPSKAITFRISKVPYKTVGPIDLTWYGYAVWFSFICPFGFTVTSGSWRDITTSGGAPGELPMDLPGEI